MLKKFRFFPEKSSNENDVIIVPNIPLFSAAASMKNANTWSQNETIIFKDKCSKKG
jgi:hypothetical protein